MSPIASLSVDQIVARLGKRGNRFDGKTVVLAGGAGFLGSYFLSVFKRLNETMLDRPCRVISIDNFITGSKASSAETFGDQEMIHICADIAVPIPVEEKIDFIIHAAGIASPTFYMRHPLETIGSAVQGTCSLLETAVRNPDLEGFLYLSSSEIYGDPDPNFVPTKETYNGNVPTMGPRACYDESKRLGETLCHVFHEQYGVPAKVVRPFNVFGPGMKHNDRRAVPMFTYQALNRRAMSVFGSGQQTRTYCHVSDAIFGFLLVLLDGKPGAAYNIGNCENEISALQLADLFTRFVDGASFELIDYPPTYPDYEPNRRCPDISKATEGVGYWAQVPLEEGLSMFIDWARGEADYVD